MSNITDGISYLKMLVSITDGLQKNFYEWQLERAKIVEVNKTPNNIKTRTVLAKDCYKNSYQTSDFNINLDVKYVEGIAMLKGIPIDHAWNKIGDIYFDVTSDQIFGGNHFDNYTSIIEIDFDEMMELAMIDGKYGDCIRKKWVKNYENK